MDMPVSRSRAVKRVTLATMFCCTGLTALAENKLPTNALQAVPSSDVVIFQVPGDPLGRHQNIDGGIIDTTKELRVSGDASSYSLRPYIKPRSVADFVRSIEPEQEGEDVSDDARRLASTDSRSTPSSGDDQKKLPVFPPPSMEVLHLGQPVHQDAVNFKTPDYVSTQVTPDSRGMINAVEEEAALVEEMPWVTEGLADRSRDTASIDGFAMLALDQLDVPRPEESLLATGIPNVTSAIHANRLRELAIVSLRDAKSHVQRRATHSARKYVLEALRLAIDVEDSIAGGNQHMRDLQAGLAAIRESRDFGGMTGSLSTRSMKRMVTVHETATLKEKDLSKMSALEATEAYLQEARSRLVRAAGSSLIASEAFILLGVIEKQMSERANTHSGAIALMYQSTAVDVAPGSAAAHRAYGKTQLEQGLIRQAIQSFSASLALAPSRSAYQGLLNASRMIGDVGTARRCLAALENPDLASESSVTRLSPRQFASSYRPTIAPTPSPSLGSDSSVVSQPSPSPPSSSSTIETKKSRLSFRSLFSFGR